MEHPPFAVKKVITFYFYLNFLFYLPFAKVLKYQNIYLTDMNVQITSNNYTYSGFPGAPYYELAYEFSVGNVTFTSSTYCI